MKLVHTSLFVFAAFVLASTLPVRMRTREIRTPAQQGHDTSQNIVCAVRNLQNAVNNVEIEREVPCETLSHSNVQMLLSKLESLREYAIREGIFGSLTSPVDVELLLQVMNDTFPAIEAHVGNVTGEGDFNFSGSSESNIPDCVNEICRDNCSVCIANCGVHQLRRGVLDLIALIEADFFPECAVCVDGGVQTEAVELADTLVSITDELFLIVPENYQCIPVVSSSQMYHCDQLLELVSRLENISSWMNDSLTSVENSESFSRLGGVVERLNIAVLPELRQSIETLEKDNCTDLQASECDVELQSPAEIAQSIDNLLSQGLDRACTLELLVNLRLLNLLQFNYSRLVRDLLPLVGILQNGEGGTANEC